MSTRLRGALLVLASAAGFGSMALFGRWAQQDGVDTMPLVLVRFAIAAALLAAVLVVRRAVLPGWRRAWPVAVMGGVGYVGQATCYFLALEHADASLVALLLYLYPAFVTVLAVLFLRERPTVVVVLALLTSLVGTALVVGGGTGRPLGIALGVGAALIYSVYIVAGSVVTDGIDPVVVSTVVCSAAAVVTGAAVLVLVASGHHQQFPATGRAWISVTAIAVVGSVVAILAFFAGLRLLGPTATSVLSTAEPVVTVVLALVFLDESLGLAQLAGGLLVIGAVAWLALAQRHPVAEVERPPV